MTAPEVAPTGRHRRVLWVVAVLVLGFFYAPIAVLTLFSFSDSDTVGSWGGWTTRWYSAFARNDQVQDALSVSLRVAVVSTVVAVVLGTTAAFALERFEFRGRRVFDGLLYLPIIVPDVTMAVSMLLFFSKGLEALDDWFGLGWEKGISTVVVSHIAFNISFVSVVVRARLAGLDTSLEDAASDLYAGRWATFRLVTLPQILPGVAGGALLAFTLSLDDVVITQFTLGPGATTLPVWVFGVVRRGVTPLVNAVSVVMLAASMVLVTVSLLAQRRSQSGVTTSSR
ncbi:MAG: ABC transporter permease [Actinomycetota bacterium]